jgi:1-carboxybiuret hydrolase
LMPDAERAVLQIRDALNIEREVELPEAVRARAAAYLITAAEGAALHLPRLRARPADFDPDVRDRLIAGAMIPAAMVVQAQKFRRWYQQAVLRLFDQVDAIIAPATPCGAPLLGQKTFMLDGAELPVRANLGLYTQPISFVGLPVVAIPVAGQMPVGVQIIAAPWREDIALRIARHLEVTGAAVAQRPREATGLS